MDIVIIFIDFNAIQNMRMHNCKVNIFNITIRNLQNNFLHVN